MALTDADIVKTATSMGVIGGGSATAHRILGALCDASLGAREIAELVQREPGLAARVLKVANSAYYGHSRDVATLDGALMVLGVDAVRGITAAACLDRSFVRRAKSDSIDPKALVNHCVASAFAAELLARQCRSSLAGEAFMAALLHDFGVPVQERLDAAGVIALINALEADATADGRALEASLVQVTHGRCAQVIFESWQLPDSIIQAAVHHDDPMAAPAAAQTLTTLAHLGIRMALDAGFTYPTEPKQCRVAREPLLQSLGLEADVLEPITAQLVERVILVTAAA
jgi:HD-like signal output (HDOD) protein